MATADFSKFAGMLGVALEQHQLLRLEIAQLELFHSKKIVFIEYIKYTN